MSPIEFKAIQALLDMKCNRYKHCGVELFLRFETKEKGLAFFFMTRGERFKWIFESMIRKDNILT